MTVDNISHNSKLIHTASVALTCIVYWAGRSRLIQYSPNSTIFGILLSSSLGLGCMMFEFLGGEEENIKARTQSAYTIADFFIGNTLIFPIVSYVLHLSPFSIVGTICFNLIVVIAHASIRWFSQNTKPAAQKNKQIGETGPGGWPFLQQKPFFSWVISQHPLGPPQELGQLQRVTQHPTPIELPSQNPSPNLQELEQPQRAIQQQTVTKKTFIQVTETVVQNASTVFLVTVKLQNASSTYIIETAQDFLHRATNYTTAKMGEASIERSEPYLALARFLVETGESLILFFIWRTWDRACTYNHGKLIGRLIRLLSITQEGARWIAYLDPSSTSQCVFYTAQNLKRTLDELRSVAQCRGLLFRMNESFLSWNLPWLQGTCDSVRKEEARFIAHYVHQVGVAVALAVKFASSRLFATFVKCKTVQLTVTGIVYTITISLRDPYDPGNELSTNSSSWQTHDAAMARASEWGDTFAWYTGMHSCISSACLIAIVLVRNTQRCLPNCQAVAQKERSLLSSRKPNNRFMQMLTTLFLPSSPDRYQAHPGPIWSWSWLRKKWTDVWASFQRPRAEGHLDL